LGKARSVLGFICGLGKLKDIEPSTEAILDRLDYLEKSVEILKKAQMILTVSLFTDLQNVPQADFLMKLLDI
jgi:hypothetical protein